MPFDPLRPYDPPRLPPEGVDFRAADVLIRVIRARAELGELNGYSKGIPNPSIIRESVASSNIENINTTVVEFIQGQLFPEAEQRPPDKEVARYRQALLWGKDHLKKYALSTRLIVGIQQELLDSRGGGYRRQQNKLENSINQEILYTPPAANELPRHMADWERFVNDENTDLDPLIRCALAHYQFEAIHPFGDGNGRTGRILMVLQLIEYKLLDFPVLFVSGYLNDNRRDYYRLLREVTARGAWVEFVNFMLDAFYHQAKNTKQMLFEIMSLHEELKETIRSDHRTVYSADLIDHLMSQPITTPVRLGEALGIHYATASKYLHELAKAGLLKDRRVGKYHLFANQRLLKMLER
jgi:Fic family protein